MPQDAKYYTGKRLLKVAKGCPGDRIERVERIVYINGWYAGEAVPALEDGTIMPVVESGVVPPDHYYVWASHPESFDSRYQVFGFVHKDHVIGRARRVL
jgi:conjugal transfer pilin signal peptidase TrbI